MTQTNAQIIASELSAAGVRFVFGHPGGEVVDLIQAFEEAGIKFVLMGHESAAAFAAGTMGHKTGIPGVCLATLGPGACNLVIGVGEAYLDRHPMLAISARTSVSVEGWYSHQNLDLNAMFAPFSKRSIALNGLSLRYSIQEALHLTLEPPRGPVFLTLPGDIANQTPPNLGGEIQPSSPANHILSKPTGNMEDLNKIQKALNNAKRPVAVVGISMDLKKDVPSVRGFLQRTGIPYADTPKTKGVVDPHSPAFLGTCLSASGDAILKKVFSESDCILGIGFDPVESAYDWHRLDIYSNLTNAPTNFKDYRPNLEVVGDVSWSLSTLSKGWHGKPIWRGDEIADIQERIQAAIIPPELITDGGLAPYYVSQTLRNLLPAETHISLDTGSHKMIFSQVWKTTEPLTFFSSNGLSSMGVGVPGAIALSLLAPNQPVVSVSGDGGFGMMVQELETIRRLGANPLLVVFCDQALSLIRIPQSMRGYPPIGIDFAPVDWIKVAEGFGVRGLWAQTLEEIEMGITSWLENREATVLAVKINETLYFGNNY